MAYIYNLTDIWNAAGTAFTAIKMNVTNTASAAASKLLDLQVGGVSQFSVDPSGNFTPKGNLVVGTSGKGIDFSVYSSGTGTSPSKVLYDYEFGTWTPSLSRDGSAPTVTYGTRYARYSKVGSTVTLTCFMSWSANTGGSGAWIVSGFPFTTVNNVGSVIASSTGDYGGLTFGAGYTQTGVSADRNATVAYLATGGSGVNGSLVSSVGASGYLCFSMVFTAST